MDLIDQLSNQEDSAEDKIGCTDQCQFRHTNAPGCTQWVPDHKRERVGVSEK